MKLLLLIILTILTLQINTADSMDLEDLYVEYKQSVGTNRSWNIPNNEQKDGELNLYMKHGYKWFYTKSTIHTMFTNHQFRYGALEGEMGVRSRGIELFLHHKSQHMLDGKYDYLPMGKYPNENSIGIRVPLK